MATETIRKMLDGAYEILARDGLEGLHARTLAAELKMNHASVHYYFRHRDDLLQAVAADVVERFNKDADRFAVKAQDAEARFDALLNQIEAYCKPTSRFAKAWAALYAATSADPKLKEILMAHRRSWRDRCEAALREMGHVDTKGGADAYVSFGIGLMLSSQLDSKTHSGAALDVLASSIVVGEAD